MKSIELTFDAESEAAFRTQWDVLTAADLPSLATHAGATNRPHVTVAAGDEIVVGGRLRDALDLPVTACFGGILLFSLPKGRFVLARAVVADMPLLEMHAAVQSAAPGGGEQTRPGAWSPHVTLSRRMTPEQVSRALPILEDIPPGEFVSARLWDSVEKTVTPLTG